ncbi:hypothetical protein LTR53_004803 [Teratosphaeriaceae sp. CCFEE 6253]|nr:hypothetical protein LTR53_004803 [Teratosphaeriaceae sp. CCFEE 6253]
MSSQYRQCPVPVIQPRYTNSHEYPSSPPQRQSSGYPCLYPQCVNSLFSRHADLLRHMQVVHNPETLERVDCQVPQCKRTGSYGFSRKDKMVDHMREVHKVEIPKRPSTRRAS